MTREKIVEDVLVAGTVDWVDFGYVVSIVMDVCGTPWRESVEPAVDALRAMAEAGLVRLGDLTEHGFSPWDLSVDEAMDRVVAEMKAIDDPRDLPFGHPCWIANTEVGERRAHEIMARDDGRS